MWVYLIPWLAVFIYVIGGFIYYFPLSPRLPRDDGSEKPWVGEVYKTILGGRSVRNDWEARFATKELALKYTQRAARYIDRITPTRYRTEDGWEDHEFGIDWCVYYDGPEPAQLPATAEAAAQ